MPQSYILLAGRYYQYIVVERSWTDANFAGNPHSVLPKPCPSDSVRLRQVSGLLPGHFAADPLAIRAGHVRVVMIFSLFSGSLCSREVRTFVKDEKEGYRTAGNTAFGYQIFIGIRLTQNIGWSLYLYRLGCSPVAQADLFKVKSRVLTEITAIESTLCFGVESIDPHQADDSALPVA